MERALRIGVFSLILPAVISLPARASGPDNTGDDTLRGNLTTDVKPRKRPFIVTGDLFIPPGVTITIANGTVFLFESFAGLHVQGTLRACGTADKPVVFTSKNDREWNPAASVNAAQFDWNGIDIDTASTGTEFSECVIRYSVYGINSQTERFNLKNVHFASNGKADLTIKSDKRKIDTLPYSYNAPEPAPAIVSHSPGKSVRLRVTVRYTCLALAIGGCTAGLWALSEYFGAQKRFDKINTPGIGGALLSTSADWDAAKRYRDRDLAVLVGGWAIGALGATGFIITFTF